MPANLMKSQTAPNADARAFAPAIPEGNRLYAITFDMDMESLREHYSQTAPQNAYTEIKKVLLQHGFKWQQGSVYFGGPELNAVTCVLAAMDLSRQLPWFSQSVRDIGMLRIEELNDLMPAVAGAGH